MGKAWVWRGFASGLAAGALMSAAMYAGRVWYGVPMFHELLGERMIRILPMRLFSLLISRLLFAAKPLAFYSSLAAVVFLFGVLGALYGAWLARRTAAAPRVVLGLGVSAATWVLLAAVLFPLLGGGFLASAVPAGGVPTPLALAVYSLLYGIPLVALMPRGRTGPAGGMIRRLPPVVGGMPVEDAGRRQFLARSLLWGAVLAGLSAGRWVTTGARRAAAAAQTIFQRIKGLPPEVTPTDKFYTVSKNFFDPEVDGRKWALEVTGLVEKPLTFTYPEFKALPSTNRYHTLCCISNPIGGDLISNATWRGVRLRDILARGGVKPNAKKVAFHAADGFSSAIPLALANHPDTLIVYEMNGQMLPRKHGFPARLLIPGVYGMKQPKWVTKIEVVAADFQGYWERQGWSDTAVVKTMSKLTTVGNGAQVPMGEAGLGGVAYAGNRGIAEVEYSTDGGKTWQRAEVKPALGQYTWSLWAAAWKPAQAGDHVIKVRAKDGTGAPQDPTERDSLPEGATGYHTVRLRVRK
ncbi:MAG: molybdopterin-dependent oxidoreductase [Armatimonadetes bacterium]|nr:molybdopterin-dependent oxidoreductase [Armatimonadota bacterium]